MKKVKIFSFVFIKFPNRTVCKLIKNNGTLEN